MVKKNQIMACQLIFEQSFEETILTISNEILTTNTLSQRKKGKRIEQNKTIVKITTNS